MDIARSEQVPGFLNKRLCVVDDGLNLAKERPSLFDERPSLLEKLL